jgi:hypothetical protein
VQATRVVNSGRAAGQRNKGLDQGLAIHQGELIAAGTIDNLRIHAAAVLFHHAAQCIVGKTDGIDLCGPALGVPLGGVQAVVQQVAVGVVGWSEARQ